MRKPLIDVQNATKVFRSKDWQGKVTEIRAVDDISLTLYAGETLGLVGESGSGKTTFGRGVLGMEPFTSGTVTFKGQNIQQLDKQARRELGQQMQIIFQDPYAALNPRMTALELVQEPLLLHLDKDVAETKAREMLALVGIEGDAVNKLPRDFSGGQRQRIGIARAVVGQPEFILCDEPTSALDVSIQAQILRLLRELQEEFSLTYLFISHDLSVIRYISDRIAVMYRGHLVELAPTQAIFEQPQHPYTQQLLAAAPIADPQRAREAPAPTTQEPIVLTDNFTWVEVAPDHFVRRENDE